MDNALSLTVSPASLLDQEAITRGLQEHIQAVDPRLADETHDIPLALAVRDAHGAVVAGLIGACFWQALEIETLWVTATLRRTGLGRRLLAAAEDRARTLGAQVAYLKTVQAVEFYERCGYCQCGHLERPLGTSLYFLRKALA